MTARQRPSPCPAARRHLGPLSAAAAGAASCTWPARAGQPSSLTGALATATGALVWNTILPGCPRSQSSPTPPTAAAGQLARHRLRRVRPRRRHRCPPRPRIAGHRPNPTHHRAGPVVRPSRVPGRRLPVLTGADSFPPLVPSTLHAMAFPSPSREVSPAGATPQRRGGRPRRCGSGGAPTAAPRPGGHDPPAAATDGLHHLVHREDALHWLQSRTRSGRSGRRRPRPRGSRRCRRRRPGSTQAPSCSLSFDVLVAVGVGVERGLEAEAGSTSGTRPSTSRRAALPGQLERVRRVVGVDAVLEPLHLQRQASALIQPNSSRSCSQATALGNSSRVPRWS